MFHALLPPVFNSNWQLLLVQQNNYSFAWITTDLFELKFPSYLVYCFPCLSTPFHCFVGVFWFSFPNTFFLNLILLAVTQEIIVWITIYKSKMLMNILRFLLESKIKSWKIFLIYFLKHLCFIAMYWVFVFSSPNFITPVFICTHQHICSSAHSPSLYTPVLYPETFLCLRHICKHRYFSTYFNKHSTFL